MITAMGKVSSADSANALARVSQASADGSLTFLAWIHSFLRQEVYQVRSSTAWNPATIRHAHGFMT